MEAATRKKRKALLGFVSSRMGDKSVKVTIPYKIPHPRYRKVISRATVVHVHDEKNEAKVGDRVEIMETRPLSRLKRWRLVKIVAAAAVAATDTVATDTVAAEPAAEAGKE